MEDSTPNRYRNAEGQLDLFEEEVKQERYFRKVAMVIVAGVVFVLFVLPAFAGQVRTIACSSFETSAKLMTTLTADGPVPFRHELTPYVVKNECIVAVVPTPPPSPPFVEMQNGDFRAGMFVVSDGIKEWFAILMNDIKKHPKYALPI